MQYEFLLKINNQIETKYQSNIYEIEGMNP